MARCTTNLALLTALGMSKRAADGDCLSVARPFVKAKDLSVIMFTAEGTLRKAMMTEPR